MMRVLSNERGNVAIFVLGLLVINMILFVFVLNLGSIFATKEKSASIAQQATLVATSVFYEEVRKTITTYEDETLEGALQAFFEDFDEKVKDRKNYLINSGGYSGWSVNEVETEAFDQVLNEELNKVVVRMKLKELLIEENVEEKVIERVKWTITKNEGLLDSAQLKVEDDQFHVKASQEFTSTEYGDFIKQFKDNVYQKASGPRIDFLERIWNKPTTINLDE